MGVLIDSILRAILNFSRAVFNCSSEGFRKLPVNTTDASVCRTSSSALSSIHNPLLEVAAYVCPSYRHGIKKGEIRGAEVPTMTDNNFQQERHDFSLVLGGPVFQLLQKSHLSGSDLELLRRRLLVYSGRVATLVVFRQPWLSIGWRRLAFLPA